MNLIRITQFIGSVALTSAFALFSAFSSFAGLAESSAPSATNTLAAVQLRPTAQLDGEGVFLNQLVAGSDLPHLRLCDAPVFGKVISLKREEIAALARNAGFDLPLTNWTGPEVTRISRRSRLLDEKETLELLTSALQRQYVKDSGELEVRLSRPWANVAVPDEAFSLKVLEIPSTGIAPAFIIRFELETACGERVGAWQAPLQAKVWREVWVAASPVKRGDALRGADLIRERRDMLQCHEPLADCASTDDSLEFNGSVPAGSPIYARLLRRRPIVHRGESLIATIQDGAMVITLKVEALEDGATGQIIRVRNPFSRRDLHGKVIDEQKILVSL
ncbi:MAG TPA: flagellar basal body P-ring formation chaperone FlgA [Verrucomicrobiae bacterium]|nr:flagellar basal body P-ring formation chaperone FlgA [Verrucomicrobiae bacterium]